MEEVEKEKETLRQEKRHAETEVSSSIARAFEPAMALRRCSHVIT
jgi:hypothetical protein